jgi:hypothetical protein
VTEDSEVGIITLKECRRLRSVHVTSETVNYLPWPFEKEYFLIFCELADWYNSIEFCRNKYSFTYNYMFGTDFLKDNVKMEKNNITLI